MLEILDGVPVDPGFQFLAAFRGEIANLWAAKPCSKLVPRLHEMLRLEVLAISLLDFGSAAPRCVSIYNYISLSLSLSLSLGCVFLRDIFSVSLGTILGHGLGTF
ncbi:hypothetical protein YP76_06950 [Sphingobium chungbukense]|uniref:Uncharacterized protein n=1 Tax=Sphingobium chungbukense TaxID=56193 RepID=A0A0M3AUU7_9SPHN|nr:hypothetical protein YP76_06950 [Sphingobium chungbukense]